MTGVTWTREAIYLWMSCPVGAGSRLVLYTVNGRLIARTECTDLVHCLTYSPAPEGQAVNVVAGGMSSGKIR